MSHTVFSCCYQYFAVNPFLVGSVLLSEITDDRCLLVLCARMDVRVHTRVEGRGSCRSQLSPPPLGPGDQTQVCQVDGTHLSPSHSSWYTSVCTVLELCFSTFLTVQPLNIVSHAEVTPTIKLFHCTS